MNRRVLYAWLAAILFLAVLTLSACGNAADSDPAASPGTDLSATLPPPEMLSVSSEPDPVLADNASAAALGFAADLLKTSEGGNPLLSPASVLCALGMVLNGAEGNTRAQMERVLGMSGDSLNAFIGPWLSGLASEEGSPLRMANGIWYADMPDLHISESFLHRNLEYYGAALEECAFDSQTLEQINGFVYRNTDGMIEKILDAIPADAVMYLVNALAFDAEWAEPYREDQIRSGLFFAENGTEEDAEYLFSDEHAWLEDANTTGFLKYYKGGRYAFAALLPAEGLTLESYIAALNGEKLAALITCAQDVLVKTKTPKYECSYSAQLAEALQELGMTDAFSGGLADFSSLGTCDNGDNLYISRVIHKTRLILDENGTKAGAATAVEINRTTSVMEPPAPPKEVFLDRPFVYLLLDCETNIPLFIGAVDSVG